MGNQAINNQSMDAVHKTGPFGQFEHLFFVCCWNVLCSTAWSRSRAMFFGRGGGMFLLARPLAGADLSVLSPRQRGAATGRAPAHADMDEDAEAAVPRAGQEGGGGSDGGGGSSSTTRRLMAVAAGRRVVFGSCETASASIHKPASAGVAGPPIDNAVIQSGSNNVRRRLTQVDGPHEPSSWLSPRGLRAGVRCIGMANFCNSPSRVFANPPY